MGAVTPETCRVVLQWINICILFHLLDFLFTLNYDARNHELKAVSLCDRLQITEGQKKIIIGIIKMCNNDLLMATICIGRCVCVCVCVCICIHMLAHVSVHVYKCEDCNCRYNCIKRNTVSKYLKFDFARTMCVQMKWIMCSNYEVKSLLHYVH